MKKRVLMIFMIILVILSIPRCNRNGHKTRNNHGQRTPHRKVREKADDFQLPFPALWSVRNFVSKGKHTLASALNIPFIAFIYKYNTYKRFYQITGPCGLT